MVGSKAVKLEGPTNQEPANLASNVPDRFYPVGSTLGRPEGKDGDMRLLGRATRSRDQGDPNLMHATEPHRLCCSFTAKHSREQ